MSNRYPPEMLDPYDDDGTPPKPGYNAPKLYVAAFQPPAQTDDLLGAPAPAAEAPQPATQAGSIL